MKKILGIIVLSLFIVIIPASAQTEYCFENDGLKGITYISFTLTGSKVTEGEFSPPGIEGAGGELYHFTGIKAGQVLTIKFDHTVPEDFSKSKKIFWTLAKQSLKIPTYGKNHNTNKYGIYTATYEKCKNQ